MTELHTSPIPGFIDALAFSAQQHADQRRKDSAATPYINHPIALAQVLANEAAIDDPLILQAALLHDVLEDTDATVATLRKRFGSELAAVVLELTDDKTQPKQVRKQLQIDRATSLSRPARLVRLADKICNLRDLAHSPPMDWPPNRIEAYIEWARAVISSVRGTHSMLEGLFDEACLEVIRSLR